MPYRSKLIASPRRATFLLSLLLAACSGDGGAALGDADDSDTDSGASGGALSGTGGSASSSGGSQNTGGFPGSGGTSSTGGQEATGGAQSTGGQESTGGATGTGGSENVAVSAASLIAALGTCSQISNGKYATDDSGSETVPVCGLGDVVWWKADMDIDCDGKTTAACNADVDPWYQSETSATDSSGDPLDASTLPYVVIPSPSSRFDYRDHSIQLGAVVAVIYNGQITYAVFGDTGPTGIIGEASYATASSLGIDHDPETGGTEGPVYYVVFTGASGKVAQVENHSQAVSVGTTRAQTLINGD